MATPLKPWEKPGVNRHNFDNSTFKISDEFGNGKASVESRRSPPPLPLRASQPVNHYRPMYNNFSSPISNLYNNYGMHSSLYSGMGYNNNYGSHYDPNNRFLQLAQESTRPAFQSIESIVHAVASVSMMLESTYQAVHSSFHAVLGVAEHFSRLKSHFVKIFSAVAIWRTLKWIYHKILVLLRLRQSGLCEDAWVEVFNAQDKMALGNSKKAKSAWPIFLFCTIAFGGPWLIWRLIASVMDNSKEKDGWASGTEDHFLGVAQYDFEAENENEVSFKCGQHLCIAPKELQPRVRGWLLASIDGQKIGLVPANYLQILGKKQGSKCSSVVLNEVETINQSQWTSEIVKENELKTSTLQKPQDKMAKDILDDKCLAS